MTEKEAAILRYLHRANEQAVGRDTLLKQVWGYNANVTTHTLETHIYRLRQKIEAIPRRPASWSPRTAATNCCSPRARRPGPMTLIDAMTLDDDVARLARTRPFQPDAARSASTPRLLEREKRLKAGDVLFEATNRADGGYFVLSGAIALAAGDGESERKRQVDAGGLVGETALMAEVSRPFAARASVNAVVLKVPREVFRRVLLEFPAAAVKICSAYSARTRKLVADLDASRLRALDAVARPPTGKRRAG